MVHRLSLTGSGERLVHIEVYLVTHHVVTGPGQPVGNRLDSHHTVGLGTLSLIVALDLRLIAYGEIGRFREGQARYLFPFLVLSLPLRLPLLSFSLATRRQYEAKLPTFSKRPY